MSKPDSWLPLYVAEYLADTTRLTTEQHGAYLLIIMDYWRNGQPPDDDVILARITGLSLPVWKKTKKVIQSFFSVSGGFWKHKRIEAEIIRATENQKQRTERARQGAAARWAKHEDDDDSSIASSTKASNATSIPQSTDKNMLDTCTLPSPLPQPLPQPLPKASAEAKNASSRTKNSEDSAEKPITAETWNAYANAYRMRYHVDPVRNAKVNALLAQLVKRLAIGEAPKVAEFYLTHGNALYVRSGHCVDLLLRDCEKLRTEWFSGRRITNTEAKHADRKQSNLNVAEQLISEELAKKEASSVQ